MILSGRWVIPVSSSPLDHGAVAIEDSRILEVGPLETVSTHHPGHQLKQFPRAALLPGLVNTHSHLELTVLRGYLEGLNFWQWLRALTRAKYEILTQDDIAASALLGAIEAVRAGITTVADPMDIGASLDAILTTGLRGVLYQEVFSPKPAEADEALEKLKDKIRRLESRLSNWPDGAHFPAKHLDHGLSRLADRRTRVTLGVSPHALYTVSAPLFRQTIAFARDRNYPVCIHVAESEAETQLVEQGSGPMMESLRRRGVDWTPLGSSPVAYLHDLGALGKETLLAHCIRLKSSDYEILSQQGVSVAHCPKSNVRLRHGFMDLRSMREHHIPTGLGTDSVAANNSMDLFEEMRLALGNPCWMKDELTGLTAEDALRMATLGGAEALGFSNRIGSLEPGKQADIIAVDLAQPHHLPVFSPVDALVFSARASDVVFSMADGEVLFEDSQERSWIAPALLHSIERAQEKLQDARSPA
ncbi:MAG: amidohydrolase family protein [Acidimicrobiia bacterium]|nr:amidohydrolase family protein [Acidimicrobiia bacterium]